MKHRISSLRDLEIWADGILGSDMAPGDEKRIAAAVRDRADFPAWGTDMTEYLEGLDGDWLVEVSQAAA